MRPEREIRTRRARSAAISTTAVKDAKEWLRGKAVEHDLQWLLAHTDEGVVWGRIHAGELVTSRDAAIGHPVAERCCPPLEHALLQQARVFARHAELLLWRDGDNAWRARLIRDVSNSEAADWEEALDEPWLLSGLPEIDLASSFTLLADGAQGLRHAIPLRLPPIHRGDEMPRLVVRHYLNNEGFARIVASRLVGLE